MITRCAPGARRRSAVSVAIFTAVAGAFDRRLSRFPNQLRAAMKALVYLRRTHIEICTKFGLPFDPVSNVSTIFEDNRAALLLATTDPPRLTPRSKSIAVKYHWFRQYLKPDSIVMKSIDSKRNRANILTKHLNLKDFRTERYMTMGF